MQGMLSTGTARGQAENINSIKYIYGKKEDNIRQFYTRFHRMRSGGRDINARGTIERSVIAFFHCLVDSIHDLSACQILPVQVEIKKPHSFHILHFISYHYYRNGFILSINPADGVRAKQDERFIGDLSHKGSR